MARRKPQPKTSVDILRQLLDEGNLDSAIELFARGDDAVLLHQKQLMPQLRNAVHHLASEDTDALIGLAYRKMLGLSTYLLVRGNLTLRSQLKQLDAQNTTPGRFEPILEIDQSLEKIEHLHTHLMTLTKNYATIQHTFGLGQKTQAEAQRILKFGDVAVDTHTGKPPIPAVTREPPPAQEMAHGA